MKTFFKAFTLVVLAASLYSCGNHSEKDQAQNNAEEPKVETTTPEKPAGDSASATTATPDSTSEAK